MSAVGLAVRAAVSALGFALVPVLGANPAMACSCIQSTEQENYERADVVFKGTMDDARATNDQFGDRVFVFTPSTTYKGKATAPQKVSTAGNSAACGVDLTGSGPFLVFAYNDPGRKSGLAKPRDPDLRASLCGGTREVGAKEKLPFGPGRPVKATAAEQATPTASPAPPVAIRSQATIPTQVAIPMVGGLLAAVVASAAWASRTRPVAPRR